MLRPRRACFSSPTRADRFLPRVQTPLHHVCFHIVQPLGERFARRGILLKRQPERIALPGFHPSLPPAGTAVREDSTAPLPPQQPPPTFSVKNPVCPYLLFLSFTLCSPQPYTGYCRTNTFRSPNFAKLPYDPSCTPADRPVIKPFREFPISPAKQPCRRGIKYSNLYSSSASSLSRNRVTAPASSGEGDHGATFPGVNGAKGPCFTS